MAVFQKIPRKTGLGAKLVLLEDERRTAMLVKDYPKARAIDAEILATRRRIHDALRPNTRRAS